MMEYPRTISPDRLREAPFGVALSAGAARGIAHAGFLQELDRRNLRPSAVSGTSIGALVAAVYAGGDFERFIADARKMTKTAAIALADPVLPRAGLLEGEKVAAFLKEYLQAQNIEDCRIPLAITATDARNGKETILTRGSILEAVRASIAVPGIFTPGLINGIPHLDGGLVDPLPVTPCRMLGPGTVVAVDVNAGVLSRRSRDGSPPVYVELLKNYALKVIDFLGPSFLGSKLGGKKYLAAKMVTRWIESASRQKSPWDMNIFEVLLNSMSMMQRAVQEVKLAQDPPDALAVPDVDAIRFPDFYKTTEALEAGRKAAVRLLGG